MAPGLGKQPPRAKLLSNKPVKVGQCESITVLKDRPRAEEAMALLKKIATLVAPIMRKHNWTLPTLCEFFPDQNNLLGMNVNHGEKIFIRLRPYDAPDTFYDLESSLIGTMLHELTHNVHGPHDAKFYAFLDKLQDEYDELRTAGYSGEGFLSDGKRVGHGVAVSDANMPIHVARERALASAAKRAKLEAVMGISGGRKLGGGGNSNRNRHPREVLAEAAERRLRDQKTCRSGDNVDVASEAAKAEAAAAPIIVDSSDDDEPDLLAAATTPNASTSAISSAAGESSDSDIEIVSAPKPKVKPPPCIAPAKRPPSMTPLSRPPTASPDDGIGYICQACTYHNLNPLALQCEVCTTLRPLIDVDGWVCHVCGTKMEHTFWSCSECSTIKTSSEASISGAVMMKSSAVLH